MPIDIKHQDLQSLRIDRSAKSGGSGGGAEKPSAAHKWELLLIDDLPAVVEHALIGVDALPSD